MRAVTVRRVDGGRVGLTLLTALTVLACTSAPNATPTPGTSAIASATPTGTLTVGLAAESDEEEDPADRVWYRSPWLLGMGALVLVVILNIIFI